MEHLSREFQALLIDDGEHLISEGEEVSSIFFLERGVVRVHGISPPFLPGSFFGVDCKLTGTAAMRDVVADGPARLMELTDEAAEEVLGCALSELLKKRKRGQIEQVRFQVPV
jgi:CRP-like cAMP-binding protein